MHGIADVCELSVRWYPLSYVSRRLEERLRAFALTLTRWVLDLIGFKIHRDDDRRDAKLWQL